MWIVNNSKLNNNKILCLLLLLALWNPREVDDDELMFPVAHVISAVNIVRLVKLGCFVKFFHQFVLQSLPISLMAKGFSFPLSLFIQILLYIHTRPKCTVYPNKLFACFNLLWHSRLSWHLNSKWTHLILKSWLLK